MNQPTATEAGKQVPAKPHDSGSQANETVDGLNAETEALRHAAEDSPLGLSQRILRKCRCLTGPI